MLVEVRLPVVGFDGTQFLGKTPVNTHS